MKKYVNGILMDMTAEEITAREAEVAQVLKDKQAEQDKATAEATATENNKTSGKQKLKDLGLNDDEIKALIGV
jgi:hypothetical protein